MAFTNNFTSLDVLELNFLALLITSP
jgi:hypothetical protein